MAPSKAGAHAGVVLKIINEKGEQVLLGRNNSSSKGVGHAEIVYGLRHSSPSSICLLVDRPVSGGSDEDNGPRASESNGIAAIQTRTTSAESGAVILRVTVGAARVAAAAIADSATIPLQ